MKKQSNNLKPVGQYTLEGELLKVFPSASAIEEILGYDHSTISHCCHQKKGYRTYRGYIWKFMSDAPRYNFDTTLPRKKNNEDMISTEHVVDFSDSVKIENGQPVTTSLKVAEIFGKEHRRVMQDIRELSCSEDFRLHNFVQSIYLNAQNHEQPMYKITKDGFVFLAMGYTGVKASEFKEGYIKAFNAMEEELKKRQNPFALSRKELALMIILAEEENERLQLENKEQQKVIEQKAQQLDESKNWFTIKRWAQIHKKNWRRYNWRALKALSWEYCYDIKKIFDANYGQVNIYHKDVFELYEEDINKK